MKEPYTQRNLLQMASICKAQGYPIFFVNDFIEYQNGKNWSIDGKKINSVIGAFVKWSNSRRKRLIICGLWHGPKIENWDLTAAVFRGYQKPIKEQNRIYIENLSRKICKNEPLTDQERKHAQIMGMFKGLEDLG